MIPILMQDETTVGFLKEAMSCVVTEMLIEACAAEFNLAFLQKAKEERQEEKKNGSNVSEA